MKGCTVNLEVEHVVKSSRLCGQNTRLINKNNNNNNNYNNNHKQHLDERPKETKTSHLFPFHLHSTPPSARDVTPPQNISVLLSLGLFFPSSFFFK